MHKIGDVVRVIEVKGEIPEHHLYQFGIVVEVKGKVYTVYFPELKEELDYDFRYIVSVSEQVSLEQYRKWYLYTLKR